MSSRGWLPNESLTKAAQTQHIDPCLLHLHAASGGLRHELPRLVEVLFPTYAHSLEFRPILAARLHRIMAHVHVASDFLAGGAVS